MTAATNPDRDAGHRSTPSRAGRGRTPPGLVDGEPRCNDMAVAGHPRSDGSADALNPLASLAKGCADAASWIVGKLS
ncbi:hypothetical protein AB0C97_35495, partial [Streptomyces goshikiensis]